MFRNAALLGSRLVLGSYLAVHGAQKLFGAFEGPGLEAAGGFFEKIGLTPGREMAILASSSELGGGILTATGIAYPLGPLMILGTMTVASVTHRENGALATKNGFEHPLTNAATAAALAAAGPGLAGDRPSCPEVGRPTGGCRRCRIGRLLDLEASPAAAAVDSQADEAAAVAET